MGVSAIATDEEKKAWIEQALTSIEASYDREWLTGTVRFLDDPDLTSRVEAATDQESTKQALLECRALLASAPDPGKESVSDDLSAPEIPDDMLGSIRELKSLATKRVADAPPQTPSEDVPAPPDDTPAPLVTTAQPRASAQDPSEASQAQATAPENGAATDALDEFDAFLEKPMAVSDSSSKSDLFSDVPQPPEATETIRPPKAPAPQKEPPQRPDTHEQKDLPQAPDTHEEAPPSPDPPVEKGPLAKEPLQDTAKTPPASTQAQEPPQEPPQEEPPSTSGTPADDIAARFDALLSTMDAISLSLPAPETMDSLGAENGDASAQSDPSAPESTVKSHDEHRGGASDATDPSVPATDPNYDGSWIEGCDTIGDVLEALGSVKGSVTDVRTTVALFVLGFSEELAALVRTAQNRDEIELILRKALTKTIDDAFDRTIAHLESERTVFEREAGVAAERFDEAVTSAIADRERELRERELRERKAHEHEPVRTHPPEQEERPDLDVLKHAVAIHKKVEEKSKPTGPLPHHAPKKPAAQSKIAQHISEMHDLIERAEYDQALEVLAQARELLSRQIVLKESRSEPIIDERMADYELKSLALDLEILKARE